MTNARVILLVIIVHGVIHAALAEDAEIVFNLYRNAFDDYQCAAAYRPIALEDNVTSIRVYVNSSVYITMGFCFDQDGIKYQLIKTNNNNTFLVNEQYVFKDHLYLWTCYFYYGTFSRVTLCHELLFHIRTNTPAAQIYLNSIKLAAVPTSLNVREYDAAASYYFEEDETVVIDCKRSLGVGYLKITYNTDGILLGTRYSSSNIKGFHINLTQKSHSKYVDCFYKKYNKSYNSHDDVSVTRIFFWSQSAVYSENKGTNSWMPWTLPWTVSLFIILAIIVILAVIMKKRKEKKCSVSKNVNSSIEFANLYPMDGPEELPQAGPKAERPQEPLPHMNQEPYHFHRSQSNDPTVYSEVYYEPSFPKRIPPACANTENEYAYADCAHLIERHKSPFDAVASRIALEQAKRSNKNNYSNLKEVCKPGHCVMRTFTRK